MFLLNNQPLQIDTAFSHNGVNYPQNWLRLATQQERAAIGITEAPEPAWYDDRFYWGVDNPKQLNDRLEVQEDGSPLLVKVYDQATNSMIDTAEQVVTKGLKSQWTDQIKDTTNKLLAATDWMVIRKVERNIDIPAETVTFRAAVLAECDRLVTAIAAAADVESLITVVTNQSWQ